MKTIKMECANCGASLEMDTNHMEATCPYCGSKLMIDVEHLDSIFESVEQTKREQIREEGQMRRAEMEYEYRNRVSKQSGFVLKAFMLIMGISFAVVLGMGIISFITF